MDIKLSIPDYDGNAVDVIWEERADYSVSIDENSVILTANKQGMLSLAKQMIYMAYSNIPDGSHVHYDSFFTNGTRTKYDLVLEILRESR